MDNINATFLSRTFGQGSDYEFVKAIGNVTYNGNKNFNVLFFLFYDMDDYKSAINSFDGIKSEIKGFVEGLDKSMK